MANAVITDADGSSNYYSTVARAHVLPLMRGTIFLSGGRTPTVASNAFKCRQSSPILHGSRLNKYR